MHTILAATHAAAVLAAPDPGAGTPPPGSANMLTVLGWVKWIAAGLAVAGLLVVGAMMAISHRRGTGGEHGAAFAWVLGGCITIASAAAIVTAMGI